jgi:glycine/D-amino acid oxidase-like deaminating enzyme/nitrite reductase/ring-hydroxylating ferredoxin subunit
MPKPLWLTADEAAPYSPLDRDLDVDVGVVGGGITGATTAFLLKKAGLRVALLEKGRCGHGETGHTSAHLSYVTDLRIHELVDTFGRDVAQAVWDAGQSAILQIEQLVESLGIDCGFARVPGYLHTPWDDARPAESQRAALKRDAELAAESGYSATLIERAPVAERPALRFADQAIFHPMKYVAGVLKRVIGGGGHVFENSEVDDIDESHVLHSRGHKVRCRFVVTATHVPQRVKTADKASLLLQTRLAAYSTYVISARLPLGTAAPAVYWDTASPYNYLRLADAGDHVLAVFGGEDHKTGQMKDTTEVFHRLERRWNGIFPRSRVGKHWSGQVINTNDGLPLIGELTPRQYVATGFAGNGLTLGTFAAMMIRDAILGTANPWRDIFRPDRAVLRGGVWSYLKENLDYPRYYLQDRLTPAEADSIDDVPISAGRIVRLDGERVAVYRDAHNHVTRHSSVCTHMGCIVRWNPAERTWDCPCHGSRFQPTGEVIAGPAEYPLPEHVASHATG